MKKEPNDLLTRMGPVRAAACVMRLAALRQLSDSAAPELAENAANTLTSCA